MYLAKHVLIPLGLSVADAGIHFKKFLVQSDNISNFKNRNERYHKIWFIDIKRREG